MSGAWMALSVGVESDTGAAVRWISQWWTAAPKEVFAAFAGAAGGLFISPPQRSRLGALTLWSAYALAAMWAVSMGVAYHRSPAWLATVQPEATGLLAMFAQWAFPWVKRYFERTKAPLNTGETP